MVKKVSILLLVSAVLVTGYVSFGKTNFWERSAMIFKFDSASQSFEGRGGRGRFEERGQRREMMERNIPGNLRSGRMQRDSTFRSGGSFDGRMMGRGREGIEGNREAGRDGGREGGRSNAISLRNVLYYLAIFAFFTSVVIYIEKAYCLIIKRKN
jgi:hypothetical protein